MYKMAFEAIKIVELMSQLNIEEFQMNQWMFYFDGFGIKHLEPGNGSKLEGNPASSAISEEGVDASPGLHPPSMKK